MCDSFIFLYMPPSTKPYYMSIILRNCLEIKKSRCLSKIKKSIPEIKDHGPTKLNYSYNTLIGTSVLNHASFAIKILQLYRFPIDFSLLSYISSRFLYIEFLVGNDS